ncbi:hypothetical protein KI387_020932, partial [Taxus chinensis]
EEGNHGDQVLDQEDIMEKVEHKQHDNEKTKYLSKLEDFFYGEEPMEIKSFYPPSSTFQAHEPTIMEEIIQ